MTQDKAIQRVKDSKGRDSHLLPKVIDGTLDLWSCTSLVSLPRGLTIRGCLDLRWCTSLVSLPEGLNVEGRLDLRCCTSLVSLPEGLTVGGNLYLQGCISLRSLGNAIAKIIYLSRDHQIPDAEIAMTRFSDITVTIVEPTVS